MSAPDGSIIQRQFHRRGMSRKCVSQVRILTDATPILFRGLLADRHLRGHGFQRQAGRVKLPRSLLLVTDSLLVADS